MLISGHVMVAIFFVISGYVLSFRALKTIRSRNFDQTFTVLSSATFRRIFRLYIPSLVGLFCVFIAARLHLFDYSRMIRDKGRVITGVNEQHPPHFRSTYKQLWDLWKTVGRLMNFWDWSLFYNNYNPHLWTIPVEFRSSIVLFVTILATSRFTTKVRLGVEAVVLWFCIRYGRWDVVLFLSGLVLAEIDLINGIWSGPTLMPEKPVEAGALRQFYRRHEQMIWICLFVLGLYLGSSPNAGVNYTPGYVWLSRLIPKTYGEPHRFLQSIGAVLIVCSINNSKKIQKLFLNRLSQYVGQISYAFYIVHGPILHGLGYCIMSTVWKYVGRSSSIQFMAGVVVTWIICFSLSLWVADIFWRMVDLPSVRFARWLETKLLAKTGPLHSRA
jgi:peptidoglycan/LPS O-acetylase OafA/YrhL